MRRSTTSRSRTRERRCRWADRGRRAGSGTLRSAREHIDALDLWPADPVRDVSRLYRRWAYESAALDLALQQAGQSLADVVDRAPQPVTFVMSSRLPDDPPTTTKLRK